MNKSRDEEGRLSEKRFEQKERSKDLELEVKRIGEVTKNLD